MHLSLSHDIANEILSTCGNLFPLYIAHYLMEKEKNCRKLMNLLLDFLNHLMEKRHLSQTKSVVLPEGWQPRQLKGEIHGMIVFYFSYVCLSVLIQL